MSHTIGAFAFTHDPLDPSTPGLAGSTPEGSRYCMQVSACAFRAALHLPEGAKVFWLQLDACDASDKLGIAANIRTTDALENSSVGSSVEIDTTEVPGCVQRTVVLNIPFTIDNLNKTYIVQVSLFSESGNTLNFQTRLKAVRVFYHLQVSPPPASATFNDVPTNHPFFPFIEALAAAGITGGCSVSPPLYCPTAVVTREQMAAFISRALGLHWAP